MQTNRRRKPIEPRLQDLAASGMFRLGILLLVGLLFTFMNLLLHRYFGLSSWYLALLLLPWFALAAALWLGGRFIRHLYNLENNRSGLTRLLAVLFGILYPHLRVPAEQARPDHDEVESEESDEMPAGEPDEKPYPGDALLGLDNPLLRTGGPGRITVGRGYALVVENLFGSVRVLPEGRRSISPQEWIKDLVGLDDREHRIAIVTAETSDGIPLEVTDVRYRYHILRPGTGTPLASIAFDEQAVLQAVYNCPLLRDHVPGWDETIEQLVIEIIVAYVGGQPVDLLIAPGIENGLQPQAGRAEETGPRQEIYRCTQAPDAQRRFRQLGVEVSRLDIGHITIPGDQAAQQRMKIWQARAGYDPARLSAEVAARRPSLQAQGRAEAQAETLMSVLHALEDIDLKRSSRKQVRRQVVARISKTLDYLA